jgi:hypothetical protein
VRALSAAASVARHAVGAIVEASLIVALVAAIAFAFGAVGRAPVGASDVLAARGGGASCSVSPTSVAVGASYMVTATGLPTGRSINLWVTAPSGVTTGAPLGGTTDGTLSVLRSSSSAGAWTYAFSGPTKNHLTVYATCSVDAY